MKSIIDQIITSFIILDDFFCLAMLEPLKADNGIEMSNTTTSRCPQIFGATSQSRYGLHLLSVPAGLIESRAHWRQVA
jgi:hypothetical protein